MTPHVLDPGDAPTPFTAAQIRDASPEGWTVETRTIRAGVTVGRERTAFVDPDTDHVTLAVTPLDAGGAAAGPATRRRIPWLDLQRLASFPNADTTVRPETIATELGELPCLRYDVRRGAETQVLWFSLAHPGPPVRREVGPDDARETVEVTATYVAG